MERLQLASFPRRPGLSFSVLSMLSLRFLSCFRNDLFSALLSLLRIGALSRSERRIGIRLWSTMGVAATPHCDFSDHEDSKRAPWEQLRHQFARA